MSDETLQVRKERVLAAAAKCGDAKRILGELFPEAFEVDDVNIKRFGDFLAIRSGGEYRHKAFYLCAGYKWEIKRDSVNALCLIPTPEL
jgi:hypothetical protein